MSQNKLSSIFNLQWELPNPQYYPDGNAPPIPNMSITSVDDNSKKFSVSHEYVSISDKNVAPSGLADTARFGGVPNDMGFDYQTGATNITSDHAFYSYLNVDTKIPAFNVDGKRDSLTTYVRDFIPATCGVYNVESPEGGYNIGYYVDPDYIYYNRFGFSHNGEFMEQRKQWATDPIINRSTSQNQGFDVIDLVINYTEFSHVSNTSNLTIVGADFDILLRVTGQDSSINGRRVTHSVVLVDKLSESLEEYLVLSPVEATNPVFNEPFIIRLDFSRGIAETGRVNSSGIWTWYENEFTFPMLNPVRFNVQEFRGGSNNDNIYSVQIIGYSNADVKTLKEQYSEVVHFKKYFYDFFHRFRTLLPNELDIVFPYYEGNAWSYLNQISTIFPYRSLV